MSATPADRANESPVLHSVTFRLGYADTDPAGILYYAAWFPWMERMQSEWFYLNDLRQDRLSERHGFWTVTCHTECDYLVPVGLFDEIRIELRLGRGPWLLRFPAPDGAHPRRRRGRAGDDNHRHGHARGHLDLDPDHLPRPAGRLGWDRSTCAPLLTRERWELVSSTHPRRDRPTRPRAAAGAIGPTQARCSGSPARPK
jgi:hypothetical protein